MGPSLESALDSAAIVVLGAEVAAVIAWPRRDAAPRVAMVARRHALARLRRAARGVPSARDDALARALGETAPGALVPRALYPRLALHVARSGAGA